MTKVIIELLQLRLHSSDIGLFEGEEIRLKTLEHMVTAEFREQDALQEEFWLLLAEVEPLIAVSPNTGKHR